MGPVTSKDSLGAKATNFFGLGLGLIASLFSIRLIVDTSFRMLYPFVPQFSEGLEVSISVFGWLLMIRSASAFFSPLIGTLADRYGRRKIMAFALLSQTLGLVGIAFSSGWWAAIPILFCGLAVNAFLPAQQAYISDLAPFERRGRALASIDIAFAVSGMVMMPVIGWAINIYGWQTPFFGLSALSIVAAILTWVYLPETKSRTQGGKAENGMRQLLRKRNIQASLGVAILLFIGVGIFMTFWGIWLSADFGFDALDLGLMAQQIGIAELLGAILAGLIVDRLGKRRTSLIGVAISAIMFASIPLARENLLVIRILLVATVFWIEYSIVALFPLYGEQAPNARATIFALIALGNGIGLAIGPILTTSLWAWRGLGAITLVASVSFALAAGLIWAFLNDAVE
ncbi:MAG: MFS transporter [Anaerolineales bacterium]|uniref:MFS transporter n=1 Tax=Candidatus Desulfolinea nitratireducens TaxID=2841698 RepID=A0A8J6TI40_9CHLR|nr:MFS transporter [Candidatus Desulfolinea nitratireducens]MBL6960517.1 MFS transporter [Anaerolineales bacterium]